MKHATLGFTCFGLLLFQIAAPTAAAQQQLPSPTPVTVAMAGATIAEWKGNIRLNLPGEEPSSPLRGEQLPPGTILDTGGGRLLLRLSDGSEVLLREHTRLQLEQPSLTNPSYFQLLLGRIRALISKRTGGGVPFELGTPSAVITVRGTQFEVEVDRRSVTEVDVVDGMVEVSGRNAAEASVLVEPGFSTRVALGSGPEPPEPTNEMRPDVETPEPEEKGISGKSELVVEFDRAEMDREVEIRESREMTEMGEMQEIWERRGVETEGGTRPGPEPQ